MAFTLDGETTLMAGWWLGEAPGATREANSLVGRMAWRSRETARKAITAARKAQAAWARSPLLYRAGLLRRIAQCEPLATLLRLEQGRPTSEARFEIGKAAGGFHLPADLFKYLEGRTIGDRYFLEAMSDLRSATFTVG